MPKILYSQVIEEDPQELKELEKYHRYSHLFQRVRMLSLLKSEECSNLGEVAQALGYSWRQCQRWFASYREGGLEELLKSRVHERGRQELITPEAFEDLEEAMKRGEVATISQADEFLRERHAIEYSHPDGVGQLLKRRKVKLKTGRPRHEKADPEKISPALRGETRLQVDLPVRSGGAHDRRELLSLPAGDGRRMPGDLPRRTLEKLPRPSPAHRARRRPQPSLREDRPSGEHKLPDASALLPRDGPGGEVVPRVQAQAVQHDVRERSSAARGTHPDACALPEKPRPPQTAHRILLVGGGGTNIVTSIARNGITTKPPPFRGPAATSRLLFTPLF